MFKYARVCCAQSVMLNYSIVVNPTLSFYPNVTTLRSGLCCRNSVCLSVCLSVTLVHPTQEVEPFGKISSPLYTLAIL